MLAVIGTIAAILLALVAAGLLGLLIVKLTTTVGKYIMAKIKEWKRKIAVSGMGKILNAVNKEANDENTQSLKNALSPEDILIWASDENGKVVDDSIGIIREKQVDQKIRDLLNTHDDFFTVDPIAV